MTPTLCPPTFPNDFASVGTVHPNMGCDCNLNCMTGSYVECVVCTVECSVIFGSFSKFIELYA